MKTAADAVAAGALPRVTAILSISTRLVEAGERTVPAPVCIVPVFVVPPAVSCFGLAGGKPLLQFD